jgi:hypothetical protein
VILFAILGIEHPDPLKDYLLEKQRATQSAPVADVAVGSDTTSLI